MGAAVLRYRVMAYITGVVLIVLCFVGIPLQVAAHNTVIVNDVGTCTGSFTSSTSSSPTC